MLVIGSFINRFQMITESENMCSRLLFFRRGVLAILSATLIAGCSSGFTNVAPAEPGNTQRLGQASGTACGSILFLATAYNFIPAGLNDRVERAYKEALDSAPGATALVNVTMQENWYWWVLGTARCVTISGEAIK